MLHGREGEALVSGPRSAERRREVVGMLVDHDPFRIVAKELAIEVQVLLIVCERRRALEVADVLREDRLAVLHEAEGALQLCPQRDRGARGFEPGGQIERRGGVAPGAPQRPRRARHHSHHRVVGAMQNVAVVKEQVRRDAGQPRRRFFVARARGLVPQVSRSQHDRRFHAGEQQMVKGRVGQHEPERVLSRSYRLGQDVGPGSIHDDDRRSR